MSIVFSCETGTLAPYVPSADMPWDERRVRHLYRRLAFGANHSTIQAALAQDPQDLVDALIDEALATPLPDPPDWANWTVDDYDPDRAIFELELPLDARHVAAKRGRLSR